MHDKLKRLIGATAMTSLLSSNSAFGQVESIAERQAFAERHLETEHAGFRCRVVSPEDRPRLDYGITEGAKSASKGATPFLCIPYSKNPSAGLRGSAAVIFSGDGVTSVPVFGF